MMCPGVSGGTELVHTEVGAVVTVLFVFRLATDVIAGAMVTAVFGGHLPTASIPGAC
jgi:hypothetical protein